MNATSHGKMSAARKLPFVLVALGLTMFTCGAALWVFRGSMGLLASFTDRHGWQMVDRALMVEGLLVPAFLAACAFFIRRRAAREGKPESR